MGVISNTVAEMAPIITTASVNPNQGSNFTGNMRHVWTDEGDGSKTEVSTTAGPFAILNAGSDDQRDCFRYTRASGLDIPNDGRSYFGHVTAPISYQDVVPNVALYDLIVHQAKVDQLRLKCPPIADVSSSGWTHSYVWIDDDVDDTGSKGGTTNSLTLFPGSKFRVKMAVFPNAADLLDVTVRMWYVMGRGTDTGVGLDVTVYKDNTGTVIYNGRMGMISSGGGFNKRYGEVKFQAPAGGTSGVSWIEVEIEAIRNAPGGAPGTAHIIYAMDAICFTEHPYTNWVDQTTFMDVALQSYFFSQTLAYWFMGSCYSDYTAAENSNEETKTFRDFMMSMLANAPELHIYNSYEGQLACKKLPAYSSVADPFIISAVNGRLHEISSIELYDERRVTSVSCKWGVRTYVWGAPGVFDPDLDYLYRNHHKSIPSDRPAELEVQRRFIQENRVSNNNRDYRVERMLDNMLHLWGGDITSAEIKCSIDCLQADIGSIVAIDEPKIGMDEKKFTVVGRDFDIDNEQVTMLLYDLEFDN